MNSDKNLCPYCGKEIHPGDQRCMQCGQKIPNVSLNISDLTHSKEEMKTKKISKNFVLKLLLIILLLIIITISVVWFLFLKR